MYTDVVNILKLTNTTVNYYRKLGFYIGDFVMRIFWRNKFLTTFSYNTVAACVSSTGQSGSC